MAAKEFRRLIEQFSLFNWHASCIDLMVVAVITNHGTKRCSTVLKMQMSIDAEA